MNASGGVVDPSISAAAGSGGVEDGDAVDPVTLARVGYRPHLGAPWQPKAWVVHPGGATGLRGCVPTFTQAVSHGRAVGGARGRGQRLLMTWRPARRQRCGYAMGR